LKKYIKSEFRPHFFLFCPAFSARHILEALSFGTVGRYYHRSARRYSLVLRYGLAFERYMRAENAENAGQKKEWD